MVAGFRHPRARGFRLACAIAIFGAAAFGSPQAGRANLDPAQPTGKEELYRVLDQLRAAIRNEDWAEAARLSWNLSLAVGAKRNASGQVSPDLELAHVELMAGKDVTTRTPLLPRLARTAFAAHEYKKAEGYAVEALEAARHGEFWWTGDAIHQGNIVLGRLALQRGDAAGAAQFLVAAGKTPGSATLASAGPNMGLARDLLRVGQTEPVIQYLEECRAFWRADRGKLPEWLALVRAGLRPDFGPNLDF
jgi:hypothetical protein